jgi:DNA replication protein DnaC
MEANTFENQTQPLGASMTLPSTSSSENSASRPSPLQQALARFLQNLPSARLETPALLAERAAQFALKCAELRRVSGVPARFSTIDLRDHAKWLPAEYVELSDMLRTLITQPVLIAIGGDRGTGKTGMACGLVNAFCDLGRPAMYRRVADFFDELGSRPWEGKSALRSAYAEPDLLVLDEVQVRDADKQWQDNELTTLIDRRYGENRATVLLSNLKPAAFKTNIGESVVRRLIEEGGMFEATWQRIDVLRRLAVPS